MASWRETTTCEQLQAMSPAERQTHFESSIVLDPSTLTPAERQRLDEMNAEMDTREAAERRQAS